MVETHVKDIIQRTYNVKSVRLQRPESFQYKTGQFLRVTIKSGGNEIKRYLSISSSPTEDFIEFTKKLSESDFSNALEALKIGDLVGVEGPFGKFTFEGEHEKIGLLSGGIGITPLRSICRYCTDMRLGTKITLLYGNRSERDIAFRKELEGMQSVNKNLKIVFTVDEASEGWTGRVGRIDGGFLKKEIPDYAETVFYTCGPPIMVEIMTKLLKELGLPQTQIKMENFAGY